MKETKKGKQDSNRQRCKCRDYLLSCKSKVGAFGFRLVCLSVCTKRTTEQDTSKPAKGRRGNKKGKRGRELTIVIVFFHITTIVGESSQKLKSAKHFRQDVAFT
jgi:hypothetical protein